MTAWALERGATVRPDGSVRFSVWAPLVQELDVRVTVGDSTTVHRLEHGGGGVHAATVPDVPPGADYAYLLPGGARPDPVSRAQPHGVHGPSRVVAPAAFAWRDHDWRGLETADLVLYELHVGTFTERGTFAGVAERLPYLRDLGVTALELMPVAAFPGSRNWGYDGVHPYAPHAAYGGPDGLKTLVDAAHAEGLAIVLDVVYNHLGPEGNYLGEFGPYFTHRYRTPWGAAVNFDGPDSDEVRRYVIDNALYWITEYHLDGLRLDAVHAIFDGSARHILEELAAAVHAQAERLGRRVTVIAESDLNDPRLVRPPAQGGYGLNATWSDDFHHAVHARLTGERGGYYADFGGAAEIAKALRDRFVLDGRYSAYRRRRHGAPATDVSADRFVVFVQNHDQIGNRAAGERLDALVSFEARKLAAALLLLAPYVPLLFMGEEYGETNPFLYFVSHGDPELIAAVREGRRREFAAFGWQGELADPQAETTFARSRLSWARDASPARRALDRLYRDLLTLRRREPVLRPGAATVTVDADPEAGWVTLLRTGATGPALWAAFNLAKEETGLAPVPTGTAPHWRLALTTADPTYAGPGGVATRLRSPADASPPRLLLPLLSAALYRASAS